MSFSLPSRRRLALAVLLTSAATPRLSLSDTTLSGNIEITGTTLTSNATTGNIYLAGANLINGTISSDPPYKFLGEGTLSNVRFAAANVNGTFHATRPFLVAGAPSQLTGTLYTATGGTVERTIGGDVGAELILANGNISYFTRINAGLTLRGAGTLSGEPAFINRATLLADQSGGVLSVGTASYWNTPPSPWSNLGLLRATNGGTLAVTGALTPTSLGSFQLDNGTLAISGHLDNAANTLTVDGPGNALEVRGGRVTGGTLRATNGATLRASDFISTPSLHGVTIDGDLTLAPTTWLYLDSATHIANGHAYRVGAQAHLVVTGSLAGVGELIFGGIGETGSFGGTVDVESGNSLTIPSTMTIRTAGLSGGIASSTGSSGLTITNHGTLSAETPGKGISLGNSSAIVANHGILSATNGAQISVPGNLTNLGTITASPTSSLSLRGLWSNPAPGSINATDAAVTLGSFPASPGNFHLHGGSLTLDASNRTISYADVLAADITNTAASIKSGTLDLAGSTLLTDGDPHANTWSLGAGRIITGTIAASSPSATLRVDGTGARLDAVTLNVDTVVGPSATLELTGASHLAAGRNVSLQGPGTVTLFLAPGTTVGPGATVTFDGAGGTSVRGAFNQSLVIPAQLTVRTAAQGGSIVATSLIDPNCSVTINGTVESRTPGKTLSLTAPVLLNNGTLSVTGGGDTLLTLSASKGFTNAGLVTVAPSTFLKIITGTLTNSTGRIQLDNRGVFSLSYTGPSPIDSIRSQLASSRGPTGAWDSVSGLFPSSAPTDPLRALAYGEATLLTHITNTIPGAGPAPRPSPQPVNLRAILLTPALYGDANVDGQVDAADYALLDRSAAMNLPNPHWTDGDFN